MQYESVWQKVLNKVVFMNTLHQIVSIEIQKSTQTTSLGLPEKSVPASVSPGNTRCNKPGPVTRCRDICDADVSPGSNFDSPSVVWQSDIIILNLSPWCHPRMDAHHQAILPFLSQSEGFSHPQLTNDSRASLTEAHLYNELEVWMKESFIRVCHPVSPSVSLSPHPAMKVLGDSLWQHLLKSYNNVTTSHKNILLRLDRA